MIYDMYNLDEDFLSQYWLLYPFTFKSFCKKSRMEYEALDLKRLEYAWSLYQGDKTRFRQHNVSYSHTRQMLLTTQGTVSTFNSTTDMEVMGTR